MNPQANADKWIVTPKSLKWWSRIGITTVTLPNNPVFNVREMIDKQGKKHKVVTVEESSMMI